MSYKVKRFSRLGDISMGATGGALGGLMLSGKLGLGDKGTIVSSLIGSALGAGASYYLTRPKSYYPKSKDTSTINLKVKEIMENIIIPNLPKEYYDQLSKFVGKVKELERKYYQSSDDWEGGTVILYSPESIADLYVHLDYPGDGYLRILSFGAQDRLTFYYNFKEKKWYVDNGPRLTPTNSFKEPISRLFNEELRDIIDFNKSEGGGYEDYIKYLEEVIKYIKVSNLR